MLFSALTSATNTQAAMVVGSGASLATSGSGTIAATSSAALTVSGQTGQLTFTGLASTNRAKTVRDAADTILELGGTYTPSGIWNWTSATVTWPTLNQNTTGSAGSVAAANITGTTLASGVTGSSLTSVGTLTGLTVSGQTTISANGAASTSPLQLTGTWLTGGTGTTNFPALYINASGASAPSSFSTNGVGLGFNAPSGFSGTWIECHTNGGASVFTVSSSGSINTSGQLFTSGGGGTLSGTTAGTVTYKQPLGGSSGKIFLANFAGYENNTVTNQTITYGIAFTNGPAIAVNTTGLTITTTASVLTITAPNNTTTYSGQLVIIGF
jgi:hypothetical protein